nr:hypothetical protein [Tanacetum cinerariifolium]
MPKVLSIAWERFSKIEHAFTDNQYQPKDIQELMYKLLEDVRNINEELSDYTNSLSWNYPIFYNDDEHSIQYRLYLENSSKAITHVLPIEEPEYPLNYSEILSNSNDDDSSSDDEAFEDIEFVEASLPDFKLISLEEVNDVDQQEKEIDLKDILQIQDVILREKLLSINRRIADIDFLNENPTPDRVLKSSSSFPIPKSDTSLCYSNNSLPEFETFSDHTEETRSGSTTAHANNSLPDYDSFRFEIKPDQEEETRSGSTTAHANNSLPDYDSFRFEIEPDQEDNSIPPGIKNTDYDSKGDIHFLEEFINNDSIPLLEMSHLTLIIMMIRHFLALLRNHQMMRFSLILNSIRGVLTTKVVKGISKHYVLMPNILPTLYPVFDPLLPFSSSRISSGQNYF